MSDKDGDTFRVQARFNKVEYADLMADLERFAQGSPRAGRIRFLMRLGLAAAKGQITSSTSLLSTHPTEVLTAPASSFPGEPVPDHAAADFAGLASMDFDLATFSFGNAS